MTGSALAEADDVDVRGFFARNGFDPQSRAECDKFALSKFPDAVVTPSRPQGFCSYTLTLPDGDLVQFRPDAFKLDPDICSQAKAIYGRFAPATTYLGSVEGIPAIGAAGPQAALLHAYHLERIPGIPLSEFRTRPEFADNAGEIRERLVEDLAWLFALSFHRRRYPGAPAAAAAAIPRGRVGGSMRQRLEVLAGLPAEETAAAAALTHVSEVAQRLDAVEHSPWCLTHGDLVPSNIMVELPSGRLAGLVDWAEAEWLPFGMALYGVEEALGEATSSDKAFEYCAGHEELRRLFWRRLLALSRCGDLGIRPWLREVSTARRLGVLLWVGIAFDGGRMDRAIEAGRDEAQMQRLEAFLEAGGPMEDDAEEEAVERVSVGRRMARRLGRVLGRLCG